ncbi:AI-2E family transporter [Candidatus Saccharibacteria bacterium TM7i]|nr:AI-2E family transporter [Candidatus Saccharibacteria bacterium TM7i]
MRTRIEIDTQTFVRFWLVVFAIGLAGFLLYKAQVGLIILGVSFFLTMALHRPVTWIANKLPGRSRVGATALAYVAVIAILATVVVLVIPPIVQQTARFAQNVPEFVDSATNQWQGLNHLVEQYGLQAQVDSALESIKNNAAGWAGDVGRQVVAGIGSLFSFFAALILVLVLTFLMLIEGPEWMNRIWRLYKDKEKMKQHRRISGRMYSVVSGYITGQLTVSAIGATAAGLAVFALSFIFPPVEASLSMPTAAITFVLSLIPMFGATIGGVIICLLLALNSIPAAITYAVFFVIYQQVENNFISPHIQAKRIDLSALMVLGAVTIGLYMFGVVGGIIAIPIAGVIRVLIDEHLARNDRKIAPKTKTTKKTA